MSNIEYIECEQKSAEWYEARRGLVTASMFGTVMASGKGGSESATRRSYMLKLAGEIISGEPMVNYTNEAMERGTMMEPEIRERYAFEHGVEITPVGFIKNGTKGCSPDGLIGEDGMIEIKSAAPHVLIDILLRGEPPPKHQPQCQGGLWVAERKWCDLVIGSSAKLPLFVYRHHRAEQYIKTIAGAVADFNAELRGIVERLRGM